MLFINTVKNFQCEIHGTIAKKFFELHENNYIVIFSLITAIMHNVFFFFVKYFWNILTRLKL